MASTRVTVPLDPYGKPVEAFVPANIFDLLVEALRFYGTENNYTDEGVMTWCGSGVDRGKFARGILSSPGVQAAMRQRGD